MQPESNLVEDESGLIRRLCDYAPDGFWDEYGDETHWVTHLAGESTREQLDSNTQHGEWLFTLYLC